MSKQSWTTRLAGAEFKVLRLREGNLTRQVMGTTPEQVYEFLAENLRNSLRYNPDTENLVVVLLNTRKVIIGFEVISNGTLDTLLVHPREVFKPAIVLGAAAIVLAHNHPSGDPAPSEADIKVTRNVAQAGHLLGIEVLDHIVIGEKSPDRIKPYVSLRECGYGFC